MPSSRRVVVAFLASPGDLVEERKAAFEVVDGVNDVFARTIGWEIDLLGWEDTMPGQNRPQALINQDVDRCDLFIGTLWRRWGSPTGTHSSGFDEEFSRAMARRQESGSPEIWLFFKGVDPQSLADPGDELRRVMAFRDARVAARDVLFKEYEDIDEWTVRLQRFLIRYLLQAYSNDLAEGERQASTPTGSSHGSESGTPPATAEHEEAAERQAVQALTALVDVVLGRDEQTPHLSMLARASVVATAHYSDLYSQDTYTGRQLDVLFRAREDVELTNQELMVLIRTLVVGQIGRSPGWYWLRHIWEPVIIRFLGHMALNEADPQARQGALRWLAASQLPPEVAFSDSEGSIVRMLSDDQPWVRSECANYLALCGSAATLRQLQLMVTDSEPPILRYVAQAVIDLSARVSSSDKAWSRIVADPSVNAETALQSMGSRGNQIPSTNLRAGLADRRAEVRSYAMEVLGKLGVLEKEELITFIADNSHKVAISAYEALERRSDVSFEELSDALGKLTEAHSGTALYAHDAEMKAVRRLEEYVLGGWADDPVSGKRSSAFRALALRGQIRVEDLRRDVESQCQRFLDERRQALTALAGPEHAEALDLSQDLREWMRAEFLEACLAALAEHGGHEDAELGLAYLSHRGYGVARAAIALVSRSGNPSHAAELLSAREKLYGEDRESAIQAALNLDGSLDGPVTELVQSADVTDVTAALRHLLSSQDDPVRHLVEPLLHSSNEVIRRIATEYVGLTYSIDDLVTLLDEYQSSSSYYYNVIALLDLYAWGPGSIALRSLAVSTIA